MTALVIRIDGDALAAAFEKAPAALASRLRAALIQGGLLLEREVKERTPVGASGLARNSIAARDPVVDNDGFFGIVGSALDYVLPVELGSKPHRPPVTPIAEWVRARLGVDDPEAASRIAWAIAARIAREGTKPRHMFKDAFEANRDQVQGIFDNAMRGLIADLDGGLA